MRVPCFVRWPGVIKPGTVINDIMSQEDWLPTLLHAAGVPTWVSLEPVIDPAASLEIIRQTHKFVDLFKVGKLNYHQHAKTIDWRSFAIEAVELLKSLGYTQIENPDDTIKAGPDNKLFYVKGFNKAPKILK